MQYKNNKMKTNLWLKQCDTTMKETAVILRKQKDDVSKYLLITSLKSEDYLRLNIKFT